MPEFEFFFPKEWYVMLGLQLVLVTRTHAVCNNRIGDTK
jgi:hypothetical protein